MNLQPVFKSRSFAERSQQIGLTCGVRSCTWAAEGGPKTATLGGWASTPLDLGQLTSLVRCPVELWTDAGGLAWWGLVWAVEIFDGAIHVMVSLDDVENRVRVAYGMVTPEALGAGVRATTAWADDLTSQTELGIKEAQLDLALSTSSQAEAWRAVRLAERGRLRMLPAFVGKSSFSSRITLHCRGWWETIGWKYYSTPAGLGLVENVVTEYQTIDGGGLLNHSRQAQKFTIAAPGGWRPEHVWLSIGRNYAPVFNLYASIYTDVAGSPGVSVGTSAGVAVAGLLRNNPKWTKFVLVNPPVLAAGDYWIVLSDDGAPGGGTIYYWFLLDQSNAKGGGTFKYYDDGAAAWVALGPDGQFRVAGTLETTEQIRLAAGSGFGGQFLSGVQITRASSIFTNPYRAGDRTALEEIQQHLQAGTSAGERLLGQVSADRRLLVSAQPAESTAYYQIGKDGVIRLPGGQTAPPGGSLAGSWAVVNVPWAVAAGGGKVFLEGVEWREGVCRAIPTL